MDLRVGWLTDCSTKKKTYNKTKNQIVENFGFILLPIFLHFTTSFCVLHSVSPTFSISGDFNYLMRLVDTHCICPLIKGKLVTKANVDHLLFARVTFDDCFFLHSHHSFSHSSIGKENGQDCNKYKYKLINTQWKPLGTLTGDWSRGAGASLFLFLAFLLQLSGHSATLWAWRLVLLCRHLIK